MTSNEPQVGLRSNGRRWAYTIRRPVGARIVSGYDYRTCTDALAAGEARAHRLR